MGPTNEDYVKFIQQSVDSICPYKGNESQHRLYHAGFLAGYLAKLLQRDPWFLKEFKAHIEQIKKFNKPL